MLSCQPRTIFSYFKNRSEKELILGQRRFSFHFYLLYIINVSNYNLWYLIFFIVLKTGTTNFNLGKYNKRIVSQDNRSTSEEFNFFFSYFDHGPREKEQLIKEDLPVPAAPSLRTASPWREMERVAVSSRRARTSSGMSSGSRRRRVTSPPPPPPWPLPPPGLVDAEYMNTDPYPCNDCNGSLTPPTSPTGPWKTIKSCSE